MDTLHSMLRTLTPETKSARPRGGQKDHLNVFREFLSHLDGVKRKAPAQPMRMKTPRAGKPVKRGRKR